MRILSPIIACLLAFGCANETNGKDHGNSKDHGQAQDAGNGNGKNLALEIEKISKLSGKDYEAARDLLVKERAAELSALSLESDPKIPDIRGALRIRAQEPARTGKFIGALDHSNQDFWDSRVRTLEPSDSQVTVYLKTFPAAFHPLLEECLLKSKAHIQGSSWSALGFFYHDRDPNRGVNVLLQAYADSGSSEEYRSLVLGGIIRLQNPAAIPLLKKVFVSTTNRNEKVTCLFALAEFQDAETRKALEKTLADPATSQDEREYSLKARTYYRTRSSGPPSPKP